MNKRLRKKLKSKNIHQCIYNIFKHVTQTNNDEVSSWRAHGKYRIKVFMKNSTILIFAFYGNGHWTIENAGLVRR